MLMVPWEVDGLRNIAGIDTKEAEGAGYKNMLLNLK
jgi:hypothetical protein